MAQDTGIDLAAVLGAVQNMATSAAQTVQKLTTLGGQEQNAYDDLVAAVSSQADSRGDTPLSKQTKLLGELEAQNKKTQYYDALGNGKGFGKVSSELSARYSNSLEQALQISDSIKERESVGFMDNPIAYLWNQLILPDERNALDATVNDAKLASDGLQKLNNLAQENAQTETAYTKTLSTAAVESQTKAVQAEIDGKAARVKIESAQSQAQNLAQIMSAKGQQLNALHTGFASRQSAAQLALSEAANARATEQFNEWKKQVVLTEQATADSIEYINRGAEIAGKPKVDNLKLATVLKTKGVAGLPAELQTLMEIGFNNTAEGTSGTQLGGTASSAITAAQTLKLPVPDQVVSVYNDAIKVLSTTPGVDPKNKVAYDAALNSQIRKTVDAYAKEIDPRNEANPLLIPPSSVLAENPAIQETAFYKKVLETEVTAGKLKTRDVGVILEKGIAAIRDGKLRPDELSEGLGVYLKVGVLANNAQGQFERFGITAPITSYNAKISVPAQAVRKPGDFTPMGNVFTGNTTIVRDLADKTQRDNLIISILSRSTGHHIPRTLSGTR